MTIAKRPQLIGGKVGHFGIGRQRLRILYCRLCVTQLSEREYDTLQLRSFAAYLLQPQVIRRDRGVGHELFELVVAVLDIGQRVQKRAHRAESSTREN